MVSAHNDMTDRMNAEEELKQLRRQNELILNAAGEGIYGLDTDGNTTFINPAAAKMIGWDAEELVGKNQHDILHHTKSDGRLTLKMNALSMLSLRMVMSIKLMTKSFGEKTAALFP
jgi:PAS domain S-box-containing protein